MTSKCPNYSCASPQPLLKQSRPQRWSIQELEKALRPDQNGKANPALANLDDLGDVMAGIRQLLRRRAETTETF